MQYKSLCCLERRVSYWWFTLIRLRKIPGELHFGAPYWYHSGIYIYIYIVDSDMNNSGSIGDDLKWFSILIKGRIFKKRSLKMCIRFTAFLDKSYLTQHVVISFYFYLFKSLINEFKEVSIWVPRSDSDVLTTKHT